MSTKLSLLVIVTIVTTFSCKTASQPSSHAKENDGPEIARDFENAHATGKVLAISIAGEQKEVPAEQCYLEWQSYMFGNDPQRAGHSLKFGVKNNHGYSFVVSQMPYNIVPPFKSMPSDFTNEETDGLDPGIKTTTTIKDDLMTVTKTWHERNEENLQNLDYDKTTVVTLRFNSDFTKVWDMEMKTHEERDFDHNGRPGKIRDTSAKCSGQFNMTKNEVVAP